METTIFKMKDGLAKYWILALISGLILIVLGIKLIVAPFQSYWSISVAFGIGIMLTGLFEFVFSIINYRTLKGWGWMLVNGIIEFIIGFYLYSFTLITMIILYLIIGVWLLLRGIVILSNTWHSRGGKFNGSIVFLLEGIALIVFSLFILANFFIGFTDALIWIGFAMTAAGVFRVLLSFKLHELITP